MRCEKVRQLISARLDGPLDRDREEPLLDHLAACDGCRRFAAGMDGLGATLDLSKVAEPRWGYAERVASRIANSDRPASARSAGRLRGRFPAFAAGTVAFCAGAALVILANGKSADEPQPRTDLLAALADTTIGLSAGPAPDEQLIRLLFPSLED